MACARWLSSGSRDSNPPKISGVKAAATLGFLLACRMSAPALAQSMPLGARRVQSGQVQPLVPPNFKYYGGPVDAAANVIAVFWGTNVNSAVTGAIGGFFQTILVSNYYSLLGEYDTTLDANGGSHNGEAGTNQIIGPGTYAGAITITPSRCDGSATCTITDAQIQTELIAQIAANNLPAPATDGQGYVTTIYAIYFPPNVTISYFDLDSCVQFCSYHSTYTSSLDVPYIVVPDLNNTGCNDGGCGSGTEL
jgi:hypothetical protein